MDFNKKMPCIKKILKQRLDYYTKLRGLTQKEVAEKAGMAWSNYYRLLKGEFWISWENLTTLAKVFECDPIDFFTVTVSLTPTQAAEIHSEIGEVINRHVAYGWQHAAREEIMQQLFIDDPTLNENQRKEKANGVRRN